MNKMIIKMTKLSLCLQALACLMACSSSALVSQNSLVPLRQPAQSGGADGGGGTAFETVPATEDEVSKAISLLPQALEQILAFHEIAAKTTVFQYSYPEEFPHDEQLKILKTAYTKLFPSSGDDAFTELSKVQFKPKFDGPCEDRVHNEKDASAFNADSQEICVSVSSLTPKLKSTDVVMEVVALGAHEIAHRMKADESMARTFQELVRRTQHGRTLKRLEKDIDDSRFFFGWAKRTSKSLDEEMSFTRKRAKIDPQLCLSTGKATKETGELLSIIVSQQLEEGYSVLRADSIRALVAASIQIEHVAGYCNVRPFQATIPVVYYAREFRPGDKYDLRHEGSYQIAIGSKREIMWGFAGNRKELEFNYSEFKRSITDAQKGLVPRPKQKR